MLDGREALDRTYADLQEQYPADSEVPLPEFWGGWLIRPESVEFWQGRESRLHDRLRFRGDVGAALDDPEAWTVERLSP